MKKHDSNNKFHRLFRDIKEYAGILALLLAVLYASGFIITNIFLGVHFGIFNLLILKSRYIFSGSVFALFTSLVLSLLHPIACGNNNR